MIISKKLYTFPILIPILLLVLGYFKTVGYINNEISLFDFIIIIAAIIIMIMPFTITVLEVQSEYLEIKKITLFSSKKEYLILSDITGIKKATGSEYFLNKSNYILLNGSTETFITSFDFNLFTTKNKILKLLEID